MSKFDSINENREKLKPSILAIESNPQVVELYKSWFMKNMGLPVSVVPPHEAVFKKQENVSIVLVEPPSDVKIGDYISELRQIYPEQQIVVASQRGDIISEIKDSHKFPNVSALTKPFHMEELGELIDLLKSDDWKKTLESMSANGVKESKKEN